MTTLVTMLRAALPDREVLDEDELGPVLVDVLVRARAQWPDLAYPDELFMRALALRVGPEPALAEAIGKLHVEDLYLACACSAGEPAALLGFEARCGEVIRRAASSVGAIETERDDLAQVVRERLLVAPASGGEPRIVSYSARGSLVAWVRVVATREAARMLPIARREVAAEDDELAQLVAPDADPELGYLKRLYRAEFKQAFQQAVEALPARERLVLRQHVLDGLGIDQLAALHQVHRATAARWIEGARQAILTATQRELVHRLALSRTELTSVIRMISSQLDVSLSRLLEK